MDAFAQIIAVLGVVAIVAIVFNAHLHFRQDDKGTTLELDPKKK